MNVNSEQKRLKMDIFIAYNDYVKQNNASLNAVVGNSNVSVPTLPEMADLTKIYEHHVMQVITQIEPSVEDGSLSTLTEAEFRHTLKSLGYFDALSMLEKLSPKSAVFEKAEKLDFFYKKSRL